MKVLVWGTGKYYQQKKQTILANYQVLAFIDDKREERILEGVPVITAKEIENYQFDAIVIMSSFILEIVAKTSKLGIAENKIILGINLMPLTLKELEYISDTNQIILEENGKVYYRIDNKKIEILATEELNTLKELNKSSISENIINQLSCRPVSRVFGSDRGKSICRYYIEQFLGEHEADICGNVMEIGDREYTQKFGKDKVKESYVLHVMQGSDQYNIQGDLSTGEGIEESLVNCLICTQTLNFIFDLKDVSKNIMKILKPGGVALISATGISAISRYDMDRWGHYWQFTDLSLRRVFSNQEVDNQIEVNTYGNVKSCMAYLYGLSVEDLKIEDLDYRDRDYQLLITACIRKKV